MRRQFDSRHEAPDRNEKTFSKDFGILPAWTQEIEFGLAHMGLRSTSNGESDRSCYPVDYL